MAFSELVIPEGYIHGDAFDYVRAIGTLPLQGATVETDPLTGRREFVAPEGHAFRITGEFILDSDQSDITVGGPPLDSAALLARRQAKDPRYGPGNYWDDDGLEDEPPTEFVGRSLTFSFDREGYRQSTERCGSLTADEHRRLTINVHGDAYAWYEMALIEYSWKIVGSNLYDLDVIPVPLGTMHWLRPMATGNLDTAGIEVVEVNPYTKRLQLVLLDEDDEELFIPSAGEDSAGMIAYFERWNTFPPDMTEEEKRQWVIERYRDSPVGRLADDVMRDFIPIESRLDDLSWDIDSLAAQALASTAQPLGYSERRRRQEERELQAERKKAAQQLGMALQVITADKSLDDLVRQHTGPGWKDKILSAEGYDTVF